MFTFTCVFKKMQVYIFTCMIFCPFQYCPCSLSNTFFTTFSFRASTMANSIMVAIKFYFTLHLKQVLSLFAGKDIFDLMLVCNKAFILFFIDLMTKSPFLPCCGTSKRCCFFSSTTSFKFKFVLVMSNSCSSS